MVAPCGDEENPALLDQYGIDTLFPSPRGDKENQYEMLIKFMALLVSVPSLG